MVRTFLLTLPTHERKTAPTIQNKRTKRKRRQTGEQQASYADRIRPDHFPHPQDCTIHASKHAGEISTCRALDSNSPSLKFSVVSLNCLDGLFQNLGRDFASP